MTESAPKNYPNIAQSFGITGIMLFGMLLASPVLLAGKLIGKEAALLIYYLLAMGLPFWVVYSIRKSKTDRHSFNLSIENTWLIPWVVVASLVILFGIASPLASLIPMPESMKSAMMSLVGQTGFFAFFLMVIAAPVLEELLFRGIILDGLLKKYSPQRSIFVSSLLFGLVHLNPWQFVTGFLIGLFSGWIYYKTQTLSLPIIIHASVNLGGFVTRFFFDKSMMDQTLVQQYGGLPNLILATLASLLILSGCIYFLQREFKKQDAERAEFS